MVARNKKSSGANGDSSPHHGWHKTSRREQKPPFLPELTGTASENPCLGAGRSTKTAHHWGESRSLPAKRTPRELGASRRDVRDRLCESVSQVDRETLGGRLRRPPVG